jgi:hypothetical protein
VVYGYNVYIYTCLFNGSFWNFECIEDEFHRWHQQQLLIKGQHFIHVHR